MDVSELRDKLCNPPVLAEKDQYRIKFADTPEEMQAAFKLRYEVFNLEQGKGLEAASRDGIDRDEFDDYCLHLVVEEKTQHKVVGTYRIHLGAVASKALGFYSEQEFRITGLDKIAENTSKSGVPACRRNTATGPWSLCSGGELRKSSTVPAFATCSAA